MIVENISKKKQNVNVSSDDNITDGEDDNSFTRFPPDIIYKLNKLPAELRRLVVKYLDKNYSYDEALALAEEELEEMKDIDGREHEGPEL